MIERRETPRRRICFAGHIRVATFLAEIACTLRDVSLTGACIRLPSQTALPARFDLTVPCRGETRRARVVWRVGEMAGIAFAEARPGAPSEDVSPADVLRRLAESEAEVVRLRAVLGSSGPAPSDRLH